MLALTQLAGFGVVGPSGPQQKSLSFISTSSTPEGIRKTNVSSNPSTTQGTISLWVKPVGYDANGFLSMMTFGGSGSLGLSVDGEGISGGISGSTFESVDTSIALNSWAHIVFQIDTTQTTQVNRLKLFVNGTQAAENAGTSYPSLNQAHGLFTNGAAVTIGPVTSSSVRQGRCKIAFVDVLEAVVAPSALAFSNGGVWTRKPYTGAYSAHSYGLDGRLGFGATVGGAAHNFTPLSGTTEAANLDASDLPPFIT